MTLIHPLQPTLWRTCRAVANRTRLRIFGLLVREPGQTVSAVAGRLKLPVSVTSQYLRGLEARGLLTVRRVSRWVTYRPSSPTDEGPAPDLAVALRSAFQRGSEPVEAIFKLATAFTHPRRIEIFRALQAAPRTPGQLRVTTGISAWALRRHLQKLEARGFVTCQLGHYTAVHPGDAFGRELARRAAE